MMNNHNTHLQRLHTRERLSGESQADYRQRQKDSRKAARMGTPRELGASGTWEVSGEAIVVPGNQRGPSSRQQLRDSQRANGKLKAGRYGQGLTNHFNRKAATRSAERALKRATV